jgi:hypothetical protein
MILFLNRNDEKWPHTRRIRIAGRNHILPPLGECDFDQQFLFDQYVAISHGYGLRKAS